ncbi:LuxR family transcriptional regulator [Sinomonas atrocyanea]|uniref:LuxR family transcriptional regulator n=1 Tax=Sinomonas atrocyanea TaxID=37927 RepID=A0A126ZWY9_9MICC|nr:response regulator transcription factor [Sinomonas atrocyanea]AMM31613.1 LuxR family transcriptional regulator [Sinomonas atrocyanea]
MDNPAIGTIPAATRVFILSGHAPVRDGLAELLREEGFDVVGEAGTILAALPAATAAEPDVVLVGNRLADGTGIEACRALREAASRTRCIIMTTYDGPMALRAAALADADGYVFQSARVDGLVQALRRVAAGEQLPTAKAARALLHELRADALLKEAPAPECALWSLIRQGRTNAQIRTELALTPKDFSACLSALLARLGYRPAPAAPGGTTTPAPPPHSR